MALRRTTSSELSQFLSQVASEMISQFEEIPIQRLKHLKGGHPPARNDLVHK